MTAKANRAELLRLETPLMEARLSVAILFFLLRDLLDGGESSDVHVSHPRKGETTISTDAEFMNAVNWLAGEALKRVRAADDLYHENVGRGP